MRSDISLNILYLRAEKSRVTRANLVSRDVMMRQAPYIVLHGKLLHQHEVQSKKFYEF